MATRAEFLNPAWYGRFDWTKESTNQTITNQIHAFFEAERNSAKKDYPDPSRYNTAKQEIDEAENDALSAKKNYMRNNELLEEEEMDWQENCTGNDEVPDLVDDSMSYRGKTTVPKPIIKEAEKSAQEKPPNTKTVPRPRRIAFIARKNREKREKLQYKKRKLNMTDKLQRKKRQVHIDTDGTVYYGVAAAQKVSEKRSLVNQPVVGHQCDFYNDKLDHSCPIEKTVLNTFYLWKKDGSGKHWFCSEHRRQLVKKAINAATRPIRNLRAAAVKDVEDSARIRAACVSLANEVNDLVEDANKEEEENIADLGEVFEDMDMDDEDYSAEEDMDPVSAASSAKKEASQSAKVVATIPMTRLGV